MLSGPGDATGGCRLQFVTIYPLPYPPAPVHNPMATIHPGPTMPARPLPDTDLPYYARRQTANSKRPTAAQQAARLIKGWAFSSPLVWVEMLQRLQSSPIQDAAHQIAIATLTEALARQQKQ
jgi:hypothetical protein